MKICKLCLKNGADQNNSHIIPKFMGKRLFENIKPRHTIRIDISGKFDTLQDTPKEDKILCKVCEKRFAILEHYFSLKLISIHNHSNQKDKFKIHSDGTNNTLECLNIKKKALMLFNYSLIWKVSISNVHEFVKMKIPNSSEEYIRKFLDGNLKNTHSELLASFNQISNIPEFECFTFKCDTTNEYTRGIFTAYEFAKHSFGIFLVDIVVFLYLDKKSVREDFNIIKNISSNNALISLATPKEWKILNNGPLRNIGKKL